MLQKPENYYGHQSVRKPEGLDIELYGFECPELDWMSEEDKQALYDTKDELVGKERT